jgi:hypothetical protein
LYIALGNTGNTTYLGIESSVGGTILGGSSAYATVFGTSSAQALQFATTNVVRQTITAAGLAQFTGAVQAGSATAGTATAGDVWASRSTTTGALQLGGSSSSAQIDWNITNANQLTFPYAITTNTITSSGVVNATNGMFPFGSTLPGIYAGTGVPSLSVKNGSLFLRYDGATASTCLYVNTSGASTTGITWTAVTIP